MSSLRVRPAREDDLADLLTLLAGDALNPIDHPTEVSEGHRRALAEITASAHQDVLVGEVDGRVVCTAEVTWMRTLAAGGRLYCHVDAVRTAPDVRGQGLGTALMDHVEAAARARGAARIQLTSNRRRTDAHRFYERLGYAASHVGMKKYLD